MNSPPTPLPWRQVGILLIMRLADPLSFTILFPFMYYMVRDFHITQNDAEIGYYAVFVASSFALAQTVLSVIPWGVLSDRIGRRPVTLVGILGTATGLFLFGFSKSLIWAIFTRSICGLLSGNMGVIKTMMGEVTDESNRARGFSLLPMMYGLGSVIGPTIGGFLANPMDKYPKLFGDGAVGSFLKEYPYFLPCGLSSFLMLLSFIVGVLFLEETLKPLPTVPTEESPLLNNTEPQSTSNFTISGFINDISKHSWYPIMSFSFLSFQSAIQVELIPIWAATPTAIGGLGFSTSDIGMVMSYGGVILLIVQLLVYPKVQRRVGTLQLYQNTFIFIIFVALLFPCSAFISSSSLFWFVLLTAITARTICNVFVGTSINILLVETCPDRRNLGKIKGISTAGGSLVRTFGPSFCGMVFSWSLTNSHTFPLLKAPFTWMILAMVATTNYFVAKNITLPEH